ncbi:MAG: aldehyde ferredoxin oxidoreductase, partial [Thermotoga sp.]
MYGWHGKLLEVDLSSGKWEYIDLDEKILKKYIGGRGLGAYLFLKYTEDPNVDPLGEENPIILATGPLTATPSVTAGRMSATTRSPLSMTILDSNLGGYFGALMKTTGIDV